LPKKDMEQKKGKKGMTHTEIGENLPGPRKEKKKSQGGKARKRKKRL